MTPIDPPSEGQAPRAASAGRVQPPPGLLDKVAEAIAGGKERAALLAVHNPGELVNAHRDAQAAWDAVVEGLGLREALIFGGRRHLVSDPLEPQP